MAFFSNNHAYDSKLRRKRSTSATREPTSPTGEGPAASSRIHSIAPESRESPPPCSSPVSAGPFHSRSIISSGAPDPHGQSSTLASLTNPPMRASPPPFLPGHDPVGSREPAPPSPTAAKRPTRVSTSSSRVAPFVSSVSYPIPRSSPTNSVAGPLPEGDSYSFPTRDFISAVAPSPVAYADDEQPRLSQQMAPAPPSKSSSSPTRTRSIEGGGVMIPTTLCASHGRVATRPKPVLVSPASSPHSRSHSVTNSPTTHASGSGPGSVKSSSKRAPFPKSDQDAAASASRPTSTNGSGKSTPINDIVPGEPHPKRTRKVLRKSPNRQCGVDSAPTSDGENKAKTHRPRAHSVGFSFRRDSSVTRQPPVRHLTDVDLTPAKEILVAYQESHRGSLAQVTSVHGQGMAAAIWLSDDIGATSPDGTAVPFGGVATVNERGGVRSLRQKFSGKWSKRSASGTVVDLSVDKPIQDVEGRRSATFPFDPQFNASDPKWQLRQPDDEQAWEGCGGAWVGKPPRDTHKKEKDTQSPNRLWKLVKRLSSGNLKDKPSPSTEVPPPLPALPKDFPRTAVETNAGEPWDPDADEMAIPQSAVPEMSGGIMRLLTGVPTLSIPNANPVQRAKQTGITPRRDLGSGTSPPSAPSRRSLNHRQVNTGSTPQTRRSTTTRSSSPSSETTKFFTRSRASSSSSYGEPVVPPMPNMPVAHVGNHMKVSREPSRVYGETGECASPEEPRFSMEPSIPAPSRKSQDTSPSVPSFETKNAANVFSPYKGRHPTTLPSSHFPDTGPVVPRVAQLKRLSPPPIPQRNPRRPGAHNLTIPSLPLTVKQLFMPNVIPIQDSCESEGLDADAPGPLPRADAWRSPTSHRGRPRSSSDGALVPDSEIYPSTATSTLTFREMTTTQRQLTEQEKNAKWEDLLQRSAKAGGTLHVELPAAEGSGLWSDRSSVALSDALKDDSD